MFLPYKLYSYNITMINRYREEAKRIINNNNTFKEASTWFLLNINNSRHKYMYLYIIESLNYANKHKNHKY